MKPDDGKNGPPAPASQTIRATLSVDSAKTARIVADVSVQQPTTVRMGSMSPRSNCALQLRVEERHRIGSDHLIAVRARGAPPRASRVRVVVSPPSCDSIDHTAANSIPPRGGQVAPLAVGSSRRRFPGDGALRTCLG